jgi:hypothetical protein
MTAGTGKDQPGFYIEDIKAVVERKPVPGNNPERL